MNQNLPDNQQQTIIQAGPEPQGTGACISRRRFLLSGTAAMACTILLPGVAGAAGNIVDAVTAKYPTKKVGTLSQLKDGVQVIFSYPEPTVSNLLVKLGEKAGGGVGPLEDVVAFNALCTHMGGPMLGSYKHEHKVVGPCPFHLTTFDMKRHGIVVAGHATESLPQVLLTVEGDDIYATGFIGLIYGRHQNT